MGNKVTQRIQATIIIHGWVKSEEKKEIMKTLIFLIFKSNIFFENKILSVISALFRPCPLPYIIQDKKQKPIQGSKSQSKKVIFNFFFNKLFLNGKYLQAKNILNDRTATY